jgi:hypothetical protein
MNEASNTPVQLRLEWGWGPWGALALDRITDWRMELAVTGGRIERFFPCLQSMPFDEQRRHRFVRTGNDRLSIVSYTARQNAYRENPNQSVVLEIAGGPDCRLDLQMQAPAEMSASATLALLAQGSQHHFTGPFPKEAFQWHRLVPLDASSLEDRVMLPVPAGRSNIYLRVRQKNGHMAWASPVFLNYR